MSEQRFDRFARAIGASTSRRGVLKVILGALIAGALPVQVEVTEAAGHCVDKGQGCCKCGNSAICFEAPMTEKECADKCSPGKSGWVAGQRCVGQNDRFRCTPATVCDPEKDEKCCGGTACCKKDETCCVNTCCTKDQACKDGKCVNVKRCVPPDTGSDATTDTNAPSTCGNCFVCDPATDTCQPVECGPCERCDPASGVCKSTCVACQICDEHSNTCKPLTCGPCQRCDPRTGTCKSICGPCQTCSPHGTCVSTCTRCETCDTKSNTCKSKKCPNGLHCNPDTGGCQKKCGPCQQVDSTTNNCVSTCTPCQTCVRGACVDRTCPKDQSCNAIACGPKGPTAWGCCYRNARPPGGCGANPDLCCKDSVCDSGFSDACVTTGFPACA